MKSLRAILNLPVALLVAVWAATDARRSSDRGDVPGWVMITMMTAIVVIVLLGVFQDAVVTAVTNAFDSISGQGGQP